MPNAVGEILLELETERPLFNLSQYSRLSDVMYKLNSLILRTATVNIQSSFLHHATLIRL